MKTNDVKTKSDMKTKLMSDEEKCAIRDGLRVYVRRFPSQNKAAMSLDGTSAGTVSSILNGRWDNVSDDMFRSIAAQIGAVRSGWQLVETGAFQEVRFALEDAQESKNVTWVVGEAGCGKTTAARSYAGERGEVFYVLCSEDMRRGDFVREIARRVGIRTDGVTVRELWGLILDDVVQMDRPLLIFDEADKLTEPVFHYFISLYNRLEDRAGVVFLSTDYICSRFRRGLQYQKPGYKELFSRIGRKFFELEPTSAVDVHAVCRANGVNEKSLLDRIVMEAAAYDYDLRRVRKTIHRELRKEASMGV